MIKLQTNFTRIAKTVIALEAVTSGFSITVSSGGQGGTQVPYLGHVVARMDPCRQQAGLQQQPYSSM
jgi:hypothetical protein